jgi:hypothetical protein
MAGEREWAATERPSQKDEPSPRVPVSARLDQFSRIAEFGSIRAPHLGPHYAALLGVHEVIGLVGTTPATLSSEAVSYGSIRVGGASGAIFGPDPGEIEERALEDLGDQLGGWPVVDPRDPALLRSAAIDAVQRALLSLEEAGLAEPVSAPAVRPASVEAAQGRSLDSGGFFSVTDDVAAIEMGCLSGLDPDAAETKLKAARNGCALVRSFAEASGGAAPLVALVGTGLDATRQHELLGEAYYLEVPEGYWKLDPAGRRDLIRSYHVDPNEFLPDEPDAETPADPVPEADRGIYATMPFEMDPEAVAEWARHISLPPRAKDKAD